MHHWLHCACGKLSLCRDWGHQAGRVSGELPGTLTRRELLPREHNFSYVARGKGSVHLQDSTGLEGPLTCALHEKEELS